VQAEAAPAPVEGARLDGEAEGQVRKLLGTFTQVSSKRIRRLKDMVYVKEMRAAITSGEFALRLGKQPGLIDYQGLCSRFEEFAEKLVRQPLDPEVLPEAEAQKVLAQLTSMRTDLAQHPSHQDEVAMATGTTPAAPTAEAPAVELPDPRRLLLYVREDQTVDFDGALTEASKAARFSSDLWDRLNGRGEEEESLEQGDVEGSVEAPRVAEKRQMLEEAQLLLKEAETDRSDVLDRVKQLAEAPSGAAAAAGPTPEELRAEFRECDQAVRERQSRTLLASADWLLERAAVVIEADLERMSFGEWDVSGRQLKLSVVELSLLDKQVSSYRQLVPDDPEVCIGDDCRDFTSVLDPEELRVLERDATEFVSRLGLQVERNEAEEQDFAASAQRSLNQLTTAVEKAKTGVMFYVSGVQLLGQDLQYAGSLFSKAAFSNYTLRPREVNTVFRTVKDCVTLVPFVIILIIPLTPVGHVLIFSFIQKFFPDFFPTTFTERRQNVIKIYKGIVPQASTS